MASINFTLDTIPMANGIGEVAGRVNGTTAAVVSMKAAVVAAEKQAADNICHNVNRGFHTLIRSQLSQKIAGYSSTVESKMLELGQQAIALKNIENRMTRDYMMITRRYSKLFNSINKSLKHQVYELDRPLISFVEGDAGLASKRVELLTGSVPVNQLESVLMTQSIATARTKNNGARLVHSMKDFIWDIYYQNHLTKSILFRSQSEDSKSVYLPVLIAQSETGTSKSTKYFIPDGCGDTTRRRIESVVKNAVVGNEDSFSWVEQSRADSKKLEQEFSSMVASCDASQRAKDMMMSLFNDAGVVETIKG